MISGSFSRHERVRASAKRPIGVRIRRWSLAAFVLVILLLAYAGTLSAVLYQAAFMAQPGDHLVVVFPPETPVATALARVGEAGAVLSGTRGMPWFYQAEVVDEAAGERLARNAWVMRVPGQPSFAGCVEFVRNISSSAARQSYPGGGGF